MTKTQREDLFIEAINLASECHRGQEDKSGEPVLYHVLRVGMAGATWEEKVLGLLHDCLEDSTLFTLQNFRDYFGDTIADALDAISQRPGEKYLREYIPRVAQNRLATAVKLHDLDDNLDPERDNFDPEEVARLQEKHERAYDVLYPVMRRWREEDCEKEAAQVAILRGAQ